MDPDVLLTQLYRVDTTDNATMRTGIVRALDVIKGVIDVEVAGELLREIPYGAGLNPIIGESVWLIEQGNWFAAISASASSGQYAGVDEVLVGGEPPTASAVDLWMDTNNAGEGDGWAVLDERYAQDTHTHRSTAQAVWTYDSPETMADPGVEKLRTNTASGTAATEIAIDIIAVGGQDMTNVLKQLRVGDPINFQQFSDAANYGQYQIIGAPVDNTSWFLLPVQRMSTTGTAITKNQDVLIEFTFGYGGGGGGTGEEVYVGSVAPVGEVELWMDTSETGGPGTDFDARYLPRYAVATKGTDQTGIASGTAVPGFAATLSDLRIGQQVLVTITACTHPSSGTMPCSAYLAPTVTGGTINPTVGPIQITPSAVNQTFQSIYVGVVTASATSISIGMSMTFSNSGAWTCSLRSSIVLTA